MIILPVAIAAGWFGYQHWMFDRGHVYTNNAQVQGRIVKVMSPERGFVEKLLVQDNDPVKQGDLLVQLSPDYYEWEVKRTEAQFNILQSRVGSGEDTGLAGAQIDSAKANLEVVQSQLAEAEAQAAEAEANLTRRQTALAGDRNSTTLADQLKPLEQAKAMADARVLTLKKEEYAALQHVNEATANSHLVAYGLDSAKAELEQAKQRLAHTSIHSPINGVVAKRVVEQGTLAEAGQYLLSVVSLSDVWLVANIKETDFLKVQPGASVSITLDAFPGQTFQGVVNSTSPATGGMFSLIPKDNASGNFIKVPALIPVRIDFVGLPQAVHRLLPGMSAEVSIEVDPPKSPAARN